VTSPFSHCFHHHHLGQVFIIMVMDAVIIVSNGFDIDDDLAGSELLDKKFGRFSKHLETSGLC